MLTQIDYLSHKIDIDRQADRDGKMIQYLTETQ